MKLTNEEIIKKLELSLLGADTVRHSDVDEVVMYYQESGEPLSPDFAELLENLENYELPCGYDELKWPENKKVSFENDPFRRMLFTTRCDLQEKYYKLYREIMTENTSDRDRKLTQLININSAINKCNELMIALSDIS